MPFINEYSFDFVLQCENRGPMTNKQIKASGLVNTRLYLPSEASLFSVSELSGPTTTALIPLAPA